MQDLFEKKYFPSSDGGLNADDADFALGVNQWVNMENCRVGSTDKGVVGTVESIGSTRMISEATPSVTFLEIGSVEDTENDRLIYFLFNTTGNDHKIMCYSRVDDTIYTVLLSSQVTGGLSFSKNNIIHSTRVVDGLLYWTDNLNEYRRIDIDSGIKLNHPSYDTESTAYVAPVSQSVINLIRRPFGLPVTATKATDGGVTNNMLTGFAGQFASRLRYRNGEESVFSTPSAMVNYNYESDTFNSITVDFDTDEDFDQDVLIVELAVRYNNTNGYFIIKQWNKDIAADAAEIAAHNSGTPLSFTFYNDKIGIGVDEATSIKLADSVPLRGETLEVADDRLFLANYLKGYDTPLQTSLSSSLTTASADPTNERIWKAYSTYQLGIRFRDNSKRQSSVITNEDLVISIPDRDYDSSTYVTAINWAVSNALASVEIPDWAYYYDILITKNLRTRLFVQSKALVMYYVDRNTDGTYTYQTDYSSSAYGIAVSLSYLSSFGFGKEETRLGYSYNQGDFCRLYFDSPAATHELPVIDQDGLYVIIKLKDLGSFNPMPAVLFELYTPYRQQENETFYSTGQSYLISNPGTDLRQYSTLSGSILGDSYRLKRTVQILFVNVIFRTETMSPNDAYWQDWFGVFGDFNFESLLGQVDKRNFVQWSNVLIQGTQTNGLSTFEPLNEKSLPVEMGAINKLQLTSKVQNQLGDVMLAIAEKETASLYLGETQQYGSSDATTLTVSTQVIGTVNVLKGSYGTINPESVVEYRGNVYWLDMQNGRVIQYSANGLFPISNYKMSRFWNLWCQQFLNMTTTEIENLGGRPFVFTSIDPHHNELLISIPKLSNTPPKGYLPDYPSTIYPFDILDFQGKTIVYLLDKGEGNPRWLGSYSFNPEGFISLQNSLYSFKNGHLYQHNQTTSYNEFYGVQYKSKVMAIWNVEPSVVKIYNTIKVEANMVPTLTYFLSESPYQQASDLMDFDYTNLEGMYYVPLYRNKLVPTAVGYNTNGLLTAEKMRTYALRVMLEFTVTTTPAELRFVSLLFNISRGHKQ